MYRYLENDHLAGLIGVKAQSLIGSVAVSAPMQANDDLDWWEHKIEETVQTDASIPPTDREAIIRARRGQGIFKQHVMEIEQRCRITGVTNQVHLVASHCKPWRDSEQRRADQRRERTSVDADDSQGSPAFS
jgi:putative restriction endonuclease